MKNQLVSTLAFAGAAGMIGLFIFKVLPASKAILIGGGLVAVGFVTQPASVGA